MEFSESSLNRSDSTRKSLRLYSTRKGLAPAPPIAAMEPTGGTNDEEAISQASEKVVAVADQPDEEVQLRRQAPLPLAVEAKQRISVSPLLPKTIRPERTAMSLMFVDTKRTPQLQKQQQALQIAAEDDANVSFALGSIEKHINQVEESFKHLKNSDAQGSIDELQVELIRKSKRYCETENLLQPCASDMASENDFQYLRGNSDMQSETELKTLEFQRNSDARSSMGATYTSSKGTGSAGGGGALTQRPKIARTASDTKNTDVLAMRAMLKQKAGATTPASKVTTTRLPLQETTKTVRASSTVTDAVTAAIPGKRVSQHTREENLRQFEAMLAAHKASRQAAAAAASEARASLATARVAHAPKVATEKTVENTKGVAPLPPTPKTTKISQPTTTTTTTTQITKQHIIPPPSSYGASPLVIGQRNNRFVNNMPQVII